MSEKTKNKRSHHKTNQSDQAEEKVYTGDGFYKYETLITLVDAYKTRKVLCEDVDFLEKKIGGN